MFLQDTKINYRVQGKFQECSVDQLPSDSQAEPVIDHVNFSMENNDYYSFWKWGTSMETRVHAILSAHLLPQEQRTMAFLGPRIQKADQCLLKALGENSQKFVPEIWANCLHSAGLDSEVSKDRFFEYSVLTNGQSSFPSFKRSYKHIMRLVPKE